ncbi:MAG: DUF1275 domain-containing protein [Burkholderiales bacterium]|nr:DUF1275 domain-containing protein [Burkholderiales bacterium]MDE2564844.1 DUF1275 domain-containing protein [Burkholderiales bacterium]
MPIHYARSLTSPRRSARANRHLGFALAFVAGATNAGAFVAVGMYTSHMTGIVSSLADDLAQARWMLARNAIGAVAAFIAGAAVSALMINFARRRRLRSEFAGPLLLEGLLLGVFGLLGTHLEPAGEPRLSAAIVLLCFTMGLQNALITKISGAEIRTTHMTGVVTDIGIELGRLAYWNRSARAGLAPVRAHRGRLQMLATLLLCFVAGGTLGALAFQHIGDLATVPLAAFVLLLAGVPVFDDLRRLPRRARSA